MIGVSHNDLKKQRDILIEVLIEYQKRKGHDITVVFDGWRTGQGQESLDVRGGVKIIYSRVGDKADAVIKRIISSVRKEWIVVTSDREIADHAWSVGSTPVPSEDFLSAIQRRNAYSEEEDYDEEYAEPRRKGNPRRLSRKVKAIRRALNKL